MRATPHKSLLDLAQARRQHATRPAAGKQRASPPRPDPPQPVPGPSVGFCIPSLFADQIIIHSRRPPACCIHAPLSLPGPSPVRLQPPSPPGGLTRTSERVRGTPIWDGAMADRNPCRAACFEGCRRGGHRWRCQLEGSSLSRSSPHRRNKKDQFADATDTRALAQKYGQAPSSNLESGRRSRRSVEQRRDATKNDRHNLANAFIAS